MLRRIFRPKFLLWTLVILIALVAIFIAEENWRGKRAWEKYRAAGEKRGVKFFLKDFIRPEIPDEENYAAIPILREVFVKRTDGVRQAGPFELPKSERPSSPPDDIKARRFNVAGWQEFFLKAKLLAEKSDSGGQDILRALEKYEPALQQLRDASSRPKCKFPTRWEEGIATPFPHLTLCIQAIRMFCTRAQAHLAAGNSSAAFAELRHAFRMERAYGSEFSLIAGLVRTSSLATIEGSVWDGLAGRQWADDELLAIEKHLAGLRLAEDCRFTFATERGFGNAFCMEVVEHGPMKMLDQMRATDVLGLQPPMSRSDRILLRIMPRGWSYDLVVRHNEFFDWLLASLDGPGNGAPARFPMALPSSREWMDSHRSAFGVGKISALFSDQSIPAFGSGYKRYVYTHTRTQETRVACALERFRHTKGDFPARLDALVPEFTDALPEDVFDRKPLRYRRNEDGGYDLWSIGPDCKDDGAKIDPTNTSDQQADWIWHMPGPVKAP